MAKISLTTEARNGSCVFARVESFGLSRTENVLVRKPNPVFRTPPNPLHRFDLIERGMEVAQRSPALARVVGRAPASGSRELRAGIRQAPARPQRRRLELTRRQPPVTAHVATAT